MYPDINIDDMPEAEIKNIIFYFEKSLNIPSLPYPVIFRATLSY